MHGELYLICHWDPGGDMIFKMSNSAENNAAAVLLAHDSDNPITGIDRLKQGLSGTGEQLILLDIDNNDRMVRYLDAATLANAFIKNGLSTKVLSVVFIISDSNPHENLRTYSRAFIETLEEQFGHKVTAYVPTDINYTYTLIEPPKAESPNWRILGIKQSLDEAKFDFRVPATKKDTTLVWEGTDILHWITTEEKAVNRLPDNINKIRFG